MLDFIGSVFKGIVSFLIIIALIAVVIGGFVMVSNSFLLALLVWVGGFVTIVLSFGLVSIFVEMNENLKILIDKFPKTGSILSQGNTSNKTSETRVFTGTKYMKTCKRCKKSVDEDYTGCPHCGNTTFE